MSFLAAAAPAAAGAGAGAAAAAPVAAAAPAATAATVPAAGASIGAAAPMAAAAPAATVPAAGASIGPAAPLMAKAAPAAQSAWGKMLSSTVAGYQDPSMKGMIQAWKNKDFSKLGGAALRLGEEAQARNQEMMDEATKARTRAPQAASVAGGNEYLSRYYGR